MCFSPEADFVAAAAIAPVGVLALRAVSTRRELVIGALPLLFALHQLVEAFVWLGLDGDVSAGVQDAAATTYLLYAQAVLPALVPLGFLLLEEHAGRRRTIVAALTALGALTGAYLAFTILARPVDVVADAHAVVYTTRTELDALIAVAYVSAVCGPALLSSRPLLRAFGAVNLVAVVTAGIVRAEAVTSIWCACAALASVLVLLALRAERPGASAAATPPRSPWRTPFVGRPGRRGS